MSNDRRNARFDRSGETTRQFSRSEVQVQIDHLYTITRIFSPASSVIAHSHPRRRLFFRPFPPRATAFFLLFSFIHPHNRSSVIAHFVHCYCYARYNRVIMASLSLFLSLSPSLFLSQVWPVTQGGASHDQKTDVSISFVLLLRLFFFLRGSVSFLLARETAFISK